MSELQIVLFNLGGQLFGADATQVFHIAKYKDVKKLTDMPDFVEGFIEVQNKTVPVVNLSRRFNLGDSEKSSNTKILIFKNETINIGYIVDDISEIVHLADSEIEPLPVILQSKTAECLQKVAKKDDLLISIVDISKVLTKVEIERLKSIA